MSFSNKTKVKEKRVEQFLEKFIKHEINIPRGVFGIFPVSKESKEFKAYRRRVLRDLDRAIKYMESHHRMGISHDVKITMGMIYYSKAQFLYDYPQCSLAGDHKDVYDICCGSCGYLKDLKVVCECLIKSLKLDPSYWTNEPSLVVLTNILRDAPQKVRSKCIEQKHQTFINRVLADYDEERMLDPAENCIIL